MTIETTVGTITADKDTLNSLAILLTEASKSYEVRERKALAKQADEASNEIYEALAAIGFYN